ncbi:MAG TPA: flavin reductase family protein [Clostridiales bacterium]|nr:flavin reductase family protein [Clostridiales bacterium]
MKSNVKVQTALAPVPIAMVSCGDELKSNITTIAWTGIINSEPPLVYVSIRPSRHSYSIIKNLGEFVINIPDEKLVFAADFCGTKSGKEVDKFKEARLTKEKAQIVKAPLIKECPINIECKLKEIKKLGSHDMFIGEIVAVNADDEYVRDNGNIDYGKANLLTYMGQEYFVANKKIADRGICLK